jgi:hypothetical protein
MKKYLNLIITFLFALLSITNITSCSKDSIGAEIKLTQQMLSEKTWFLDYSITGTSKRTYLVQSTNLNYFLKNDSTNDSDGLNGKYSVEKIGNILQIHVTAKTSSINSVDYEIIYNIESIGRRNLILYFTLPGETVPTKRYFSTKN